MPGVQSSVPMMFTDGIEIIGVVRRMFLHLIFCNDEGQCEWHYFGTDPLVKPPPSGWQQWPIVEHEYIQIPNDLPLLPEGQGDSMLYDMARIIAGVISGWEQPQG